MILVALAACGRDRSEPAAPRPIATAAPDAAPVASGPDAAPLPPHRRFPTTAAALAAIVPASARVDRPDVRPTLAVFREDILPPLAPRLSDLVLETWIVDPKCGKRGEDATQRVESTMQRPAATKNELALTVDAARAAGVQVHAMRLSCADYDAVAPKQGVDVEKLLGLVTRELVRITASAVAHRDKEAGHKPAIAVYGGALHNDRFPYDSVAAWSYATRIDAATRGTFVEVDLYAPELAAAEPLYAKEPWFPLVAAAGPDRVLVFERGERSFVVVLPVTPGRGPAKP